MDALQCIFGVVLESPRATVVVFYFFSWLFFTRLFFSNNLNARYFVKRAVERILVVVRVY